MRRTSTVGRWVGAALALALAMPAGAAPVIGERPPDLLGRTLQGEEIRISERQGKVVLVSFWASWCGYCRKQLPVLDALQQAAGRERMEVVVINYQEPPQTYRALVRQLRKLSVTLTHDRDGSISDAYQVTSVPQLFMVDREGRLADTFVGYSEASVGDIVDAVNRLLQAEDPTVMPPAATDPDNMEDIAAGELGAA